MAVCTLDLSHPCFLVSLKRFQGDPEVQEALKEIKTKVENEHTSCNRVVQQFYGNKKFSHLQNKIWKYDWGKSGAGRKSWRMVVIVPEPDKQPYKLIAGTIYLKSETSQLSTKDLAGVFAEIIKHDSVEPVDALETEFNRVSNGDGQLRTICIGCYWFAIAADDTGLAEAERGHVCPIAVNEDATPAGADSEPE